jgi:hypothetical protein
MMGVILLASCAACIGCGLYVGYVLVRDFQGLRNKES